MAFSSLKFGPYELSYRWLPLLLAPLAPIFIWMLCCQNVELNARSRSEAVWMRSQSLLRFGRREEAQKSLEYFLSSADCAIPCVSNGLIFELSARLAASRGDNAGAIADLRKARNIYRQCLTGSTEVERSAALQFRLAFVNLEMADAQVALNEKSQAYQSVRECIELLRGVLNGRVDLNAEFTLQSAFERGLVLAAELKDLEFEKQYRKELSDLVSRQPQSELLSQPSERVGMLVMKANSKMRRFEFQAALRNLLMAREIANRDATISKALLFQMDYLMLECAAGVQDTRIFSESTRRLHDEWSGGSLPEQVDIIHRSIPFAIMCVKNGKSGLAAEILNRAFEMVRELPSTEGKRVFPAIVVAVDEIVVRGDAALAAQILPEFEKSARACDKWNTTESLKARLAIARKLTHNQQYDVGLNVLSAVTDQTSGKPEFNSFALTDFWIGLANLVDRNGPWFALCRREAERSIDPSQSDYLTNLSRLAYLHSTTGATESSVRMANQCLQSPLLHSVRALDRAWIYAYCSQALLDRAHPQQSDALMRKAVSICPRKTLEEAKALAIIEQMACNGGLDRDASQAKEYIALAQRTCDDTAKSFGVKSLFYGRSLIMLGRLQYRAGAISDAVGTLRKGQRVLADIGERNDIWYGAAEYDLKRSGFN